MLFNLSAQSADVARAPLPFIWWLGPLAAVTALAFAWIFYRQVMGKSEGTDRMIEIADAIRDGAQAYLSRQYRVVAIVFGILFVIFLILSLFQLQNPIVPVAFLTGGFLSA
jgi:K(+)-stimulated pyrophosphate-energized sodium pump